MSRRYTYSRTINTPEGAETYTAEAFDSFDEAKTQVDKGIHDRKLQLAERKDSGSSLGIGKGSLGGPDPVPHTETPITTP
jgi:hypothetical protein